MKYDRLEKVGHFCYYFFMPHIKTMMILLTPIFLIFILQSCTPGVPLPKEFRTVYFYKIFNDSDQPELADALSEQMRNEFTADGRLIIVDDIDKADAIVAVRILKYTIVPVTLTSSMLPDQMLAALEVKMALQAVQTNRILRTSLIEEKSFFNKITLPVGNEQDAKKELVMNTTRKILLVTIDGFY